MRDLLTYVDVAGTLTRRGRYTPPAPPEIIIQHYETFAPVATLGTNPEGVALFRQIVQDFDYGYLQAQHDHMSIVDLGGTEGLSQRIRFVDNWYDSTADGIAYHPDLPRKVEAARVSFLLRFNAGFISGKGGKFGPGLGWSNRHRQPASGGSTTQPHAGSMRMMWRDNFRLSPYLYDANGTNGIGLATTPASPTYPADNNFHEYEVDVVLNTALVDSGPVGGTLPTVVQGVDYLADGVLTVRVDGTPIYHATNRVHRKYSDTLISHLMWSWFRGGGDSTWAVVGGPGYMDMPWFEVMEL